jgi:hypothetical protein
MSEHCYTYAYCCALEHFLQWTLQKGSLDGYDGIIEHLLSCTILGKRIERSDFRSTTKYIYTNIHYQKHTK